MKSILFKCSMIVLLVILSIAMVLADDDNDADSMNVEAILKKRIQGKLPPSPTKNEGVLSEKQVIKIKGIMDRRIKMMSRGRRSEIILPAVKQLAVHAERIGAHKVVSKLQGLAQGLEAEIKKDRDKLEKVLAEQEQDSQEWIKKGEEENKAQGQ